MKRFALFSFMTMCLILYSLAQKPNQKSKSPVENSTVKREYDENGNLIRFDSTYTYSWSGDTTLMKSFSPENFPDPFDNHFGLFQDSIFSGHSFFDEFDHFFAQPFSGKQDSVWMKRFGIHPEFHKFQFPGDSLAMNHHGFDNFFEFFLNNPNDSTHTKALKKGQQIPGPKSMDEMMKMLHEQMKAMEEQHRKFFEDQPKWQEF
jgi:hypothetical protein